MRDHPTHDHPTTSAHWRAPAPEGAFTQDTRVRSYEVGRVGTIGVGTVLRYFESLATEASAALGFDHRWYERNRSAWVVRDFDLRFGPLPGIGAGLTLATWVADAGHVQARRECLARERDTGRVVARASARWAYVDRHTGRITRLQDDLAAGIPIRGRPMAPRSLAIPADAALMASGDFMLEACEYEADSQRHINNCVYADWLAEGVSRALASGDLGGGGSHRAPDGTYPRYPRPRYTRIEYVRPALPGAAIRVHTDVYRTGTRGTLATQTITDAADDALYVRARSLSLASLMV